MRFVTAASIVAVSALTLVGCQDKKTAAANRDLFNENQQLKSIVAEYEGKLQSDVSTLQAELAARDAKIAELQASLSSEPGIDGVETEYDAAKKTLTVKLPGDVLFPAGTATLKPTSTKTLDTIAAALKNDFSGKKIKIQGHTDADPIKRTAKVWKDNRELSVERALTVTRYLEGKGVSPQAIETAGFGEFAPRSEKKDLNRRVEVVVYMD